MAVSTTGERRETSGRRVWSGRRAILGRGAFGFLVFLLVLEAVTRAGLVHSYYLPPASTILWQAVLLIGNLDFLNHVWGTVRATLMGLGLSVAVGIPLGIVLGSWQMVYRASRAVIEFIRPIPSVALIPLMIMIFGSGTEMKVVMVLTGAVWPILFNTIYGVHSVDAVAKDTARSFGYGPVGVLLYVSLPSSLPFMYTGIRIAAAIALIVTMSAEILAGSAHGLGSWLLLMGEMGRPPALVFAGTVLAGVLGWGMNLALRAVQVRYLAWDPSSRQESTV